MQNRGNKENVTRQILRWFFNS